jgi:hypothetical protein
MFDPADVKPSVMNWLIVGIMALTFLVIAKVALAKFKVPGLSEIVAQA